MAVRVAADKRFKRARVKPPRRRRAWRTVSLAAVRVVVILGVIAYAAQRGTALVTTAPALRVEQIRIQGTRQLSDQDVRSLLRGLTGENIVATDVDRWRARLLRSPWIRDATIHRALPSMIDVTIVEREPMGIGRIGDRLYVVAPDGVILGTHGPRFAGVDLPLVDGLHPGPGASGLLVDDERAALAADVLQSVKGAPQLDAAISQVDVSDAEDAVVMLGDDPVRLHLGREQFAERLRAYLELAPSLKVRVAAIDSVDLRYGSRVFVMPARARRR